MKMNKQVLHLCVEAYIHKKFGSTAKVSSVRLISNNPNESKALVVGRGFEEVIDLVAVAGNAVSIILDEPVK